VQPSSIGTPQRGGRQVLYLPNHGINSSVFCDCFSVILVFGRARYLAILTLNQVLWLLVVEFYRITYSPPSRCSHIPISNNLQRLYTLPTSRDPFMPRVDQTLKHYQGESARFHYVAFTKTPLVHSCSLGFASRTKAVHLPKVGD
jgi:hypothetical protein